MPFPMSGGWLILFLPWGILLIRLSVCGCFSPEAYTCFSEADCVALVCAQFANYFFPSCSKNICQVSKYDASIE